MRCGSLLEEISAKRMALSKRGMRDENAGLLETWLLLRSRATGGIEFGICENYRLESERFCADY